MRLQARSRSIHPADSPSHRRPVYCLTRVSPQTPHRNRTMVAGIKRDCQPGRGGSLSSHAAEMDPFAAMSRGLFVWNAWFLLLEYNG